MSTNDYWTHNVAYHNWILDQISPGDRVIDVGCGDGLLLQKLAARCAEAIGIEPHGPSAEAARLRLAGMTNAEVLNTSFEDYGGTEADAVIFAASIHHMYMAAALEKAASLLAPGGRIIIVGCARPEGAGNMLIEALRVIPAKIGSIIHGEKNGGEIGVPTAQPPLPLKNIRSIAQKYCPGAKIRRGLYYRYLLLYKKEAGK